MTTSIEGRIAEELGVRERQVKAAVDLLDGGSTVPFIARYRKEATEMLDDAQLRTLEERLRYLRELGGGAGGGGRGWGGSGAPPRPPPAGGVIKKKTP
ncbi:Tex-like N-terminal domain-containing protein, partial [[Kitasatospora] papulosa]|uniref:Tex-like N-terminal domain-containing protein n=1 Tax=[Kitasatospora] papulosa TaxID=1464011 RepID=UPI0036D04392